MPRIPLTSGAYQARSVIAGAQRCVNLYPESNPEDSQAPVPVTHYPTPGLVKVGQFTDASVVRGMYRATNGDVYAVCGSSVYFVASNTAGYALNFLGTIANGTKPISMRDNGLAIILVDGTSMGYVIDLATRSFAQIADTNFLGADRVDYIDTFFVLNKPGTRIFYISQGLVNYALLTTVGAGAAFNALDIVGKSGGADPVSTVLCVHRELWVFGTLTSEVWANQGTADFPLAIIPGTFIEHGCVAKYSVASHDLIPFWLSQDREGRGIVCMGVGYTARRISTHAIEALIQSYPIIEDAVGFCYQIIGHVFYVLTFPSANITFVYEVSSGQWHQWAAIDSSGALQRHYANCMVQAYGSILVGDWKNGSLYVLDPNTFTDNGSPILRVRSFPHLIEDGKRRTYLSFIADMQVGEISGLLAKADPAGAPSTAPQITLRWSDTKGASWSDRIVQDLGATGRYYTSIKFNRLGMARDRVFEISWDAPVNTALNGAFIESETLGS